MSLDCVAAQVTAWQLGYRIKEGGRSLPVLELGGKSFTAAQLPVVDLILAAEGSMGEPVKMQVVMDSMRDAARGQPGAGARLRPARVAAMDAEADRRVLQHRPARAKRALGADVHVGAEPVRNEAGPGQGQVPAVVAVPGFQFGSAPAGAGSSPSQVMADALQARMSGGSASGWSGQDQSVASRLSGARGGGGGVPGGGSGSGSGGGGSGSPFVPCGVEVLQPQVRVAPAEADAGAGGAVVAPRRCSPLFTDADLMDAESGDMDIDF
jgi:hypothetical protein